jgi:hypothetical protein
MGEERLDGLPVMRFGSAAALRTWRFEELLDEGLRFGRSESMRPGRRGVIPSALHPAPHDRDDLEAQPGAGGAAGPQGADDDLGTEGAGHDGVARLR